MGGKWRSWGGFWFVFVDRGLTLGGLVFIFGPKEVGGLLVYLGSGLGFGLFNNKGPFV